MTQQKWETRPLQCWEKAKELRRKHSQDVIGAHDKRKSVIEGSDAILWGFENLRPVIGPPQVALMQNANSKFTRECQAAAESWGLGRVLCGYRRGFYGTWLTNRDLSGGAFPGRDLCLATPAPCDDHTKDIGPTSDYLGIPRFQRDGPNYIGSNDEKRDQLMVDHTVGQLLDAIEWLEKVTGKAFDDENFIETAKNEMRLHKLAGEALCLNQNIPAPLDMKSLYSCYTLGGLVKSEWENTVSFWRELRDELQWRVDNHIAALPTERYRFIEHEPPPWHYLKYLRYLEKYGAVGLGSRYTFGIGGPYDVREDGSYAPKKNPLDLGMPMNTREEVIRAKMYLRMSGRSPQADARLHTQQIVAFAKAFHANGAILPLWLSAVGCVYGMSEIRVQLAGAGVGVLHYEGSQPGDRRDLDENRMFDQIDVWMQSQGLHRLED